ncbi:peptide maturation system acyl carrier-related protein [Ruminiclostridium herbifermentans]|uniref:Peptide maturation system acyl carrier-related protein n=1 Tax=Ruminiclostridium herbifermentans TaxID=2488810 RepID=A0A4U7JBC0_9FIRM|nr:peptide maturation system acyl carrier-related protein [Ruminiclostridium herbifermentans]QNU67844.1 peptide maturation system acyl carrier-related protein [Ruminiclostridium herbifermentans]
MEHIEKKLDDIFKRRFGIEMGQNKDKFRDKKLLGQEFGMPPRDLLYLFFDVEKEFSIKIPQDAIVSGQFSTYNGICKIIYDELRNG